MSFWFENPYGEPSDVLLGLCEGEKIKVEVWNQMGELIKRRPWGLSDLIDLIAKIFHFKIHFYLNVNVNKV